MEMQTADVACDRIDEEVERFMDYNETRIARQMDEQRRWDPKLAGTGFHGSQIQSIGMARDMV